MTATTIAFIGQCHVTGYPGVPPEATFPEVCKRSVMSKKPGTEIDVTLIPYHHPVELPKAVSKALKRTPRVLVIEVPGWLAVKGKGAVDLSRLPPGVGSAYDRVRFFRYVGNAMISRFPKDSLIQRVKTTADDLGRSILAPLLPRLPRASVADYELMLRSGVESALAQNASVVIQGPAALNPEIDWSRLSGDAMERYRGVEVMARRVASEMGALFVDRWDTSAPGFYTPGRVRPSKDGHVIWGHLLADHLLAHGLV